MDNDSIYIYPDKSRMNMSGQLYNCTDGDIDGLFRNSVSGECVFVGEHTIDGMEQFDKLRRSIDGSFFQKDDIEVLSDDELYDLECYALEVFHSDDRLNSIIYPYTFDIQKDLDGKIVLYTINEVPEDFRSKYKKYTNVVFDSKFAINVRLSVIANVLDVLQALNEKFNNYFKYLDNDAIYIDVESGDIKIFLEKLIASQVGKAKESINTDIAYIVFELLCMANPYDGKKTLVEFPLLTYKSKESINCQIKEFVFADNENDVSKYIGREMVARWNALPPIIRNVLEDNLDKGRTSITYDINDWIFAIRKLRDLLVFVNRSFRFCNPAEKNQILYFRIDEFLVPIWPRKALYGYHVGEADYLKSRQVILGVNQEGKVVNHSTMDIFIKSEDKQVKVETGEVFLPESGMEILVDNKCIAIVNASE